MALYFVLGLCALLAALLDRAGTVCALKTSPRCDQIVTIRTEAASKSLSLNRWARYGAEGGKRPGRFLNLLMARDFRH